MMLKHLRDLQDFAIGMGLSVDGFNHGRKHIKMALSKGDRRFHVVVGTSPSCARAEMNSKAVIRRFAKGAI